jgi:hypothetical protein
MAKPKLDKRIYDYEILCFACKPNGKLSKQTIFIGKDEDKMNEAIKDWKKLNPTGKIEQVDVKVVL